VVTGVRRCGKSTLLKQISTGLPSFLYLNADDDRLIGAMNSELGSLLLIWEEIMPGAEQYSLTKFRTFQVGNGS
jgi:predicted AAA+ superfamily ATPase